MDHPPRAGGPPPPPPPQQRPHAPQAHSGGTAPTRYSSPPDIAPRFLTSPRRPADAPLERSPRNESPPQPEPDLPYPLLLEPERPTARAVLGFVLLVVPVFATVTAYLLPSLRMIELSRIEGLSVFEPEGPTGPANFDTVFAEGAFTAGLTSLAGPVALMILAGAVLAPLAAWRLHLAGGGVRTAARVVWSLAAIAFAPAAFTVSWLISRLLAEREASLYDWPGLISGVVVGLGILAGLAALRGADETGRKAAPLLVTAGLAAFAIAAAGLQTFAYSVISAPETETPVAQIFRGLYSGFTAGLSAAMSVLLLAILAALGLGAAVLFAAAHTRIDVAPGPDDPAPARRATAVVGAAVLVVLLAAVGYYLLPWIVRITDDTREGADLWLSIRRTWGPPLVTTAVALPVAALGGFAIGAVRPLGRASRWLLLLFAPWLFTGSGPLGAANLEVVAGEGEYMVIGAFPARAWIALPLLFVFTALFWGLEDRRRAALAAGVEAGAARAAFAKAAWPVTALLAAVLLLVNAQDLFWQQLTFQDMLSSGPMIWALENGEYEQSGVALGFPVPILIGYALVAAVFAVRCLPRLAIKTGRDLPGVRERGPAIRRPLRPYSGGRFRATAGTPVQARTNSMSWKRRAAVS